MEHTSDSVGGVDDLEDAHPAAALAADGDVDGEHAGEEAGPADAARGLGFGRVGRLGGVAAGEGERELLAGEHGVAAGDDARAEVMVAGEDAEVADHVEARRRDEGTQAREELVGVHVGVGDAATPRGLEVDADAAIGERLDGIVREGRAQEVTAEAPWLLAIATVDGRRGVQVHAEGRQRQRRRGDGLGHGREVRAGERALHAGAKHIGATVDIVALFVPERGKSPVLRAFFDNLAKYTAELGEVV